MLDFLPTRIQQKLVEIATKAAVCLAFFILGCLTVWHHDSVKEAKVEAVQQTAQVGINAGSAAIDSATLAARDRQLKDLKTQNQHLAQLLEKTSHETPAPAACHLPDSVLAEINGQLSTDQPGTSDPVR